MALRVAKPNAGIIKTLLLYMTSHPNITIPLAQFAGFVGRNLDKKVFSEVAQGYSTMDFSVYFELSERMNEHSAEDILEHIKVPVLIIHGDRDLMTPHALTKIMVDKIPNVELLTVPFGSHYCVLEYPEMVNLKLEKYLSNFQQDGGKGD